MGDQIKNPTRVFCYGCFDIFHYGHANLLRQAKALGDVLVVGVHSDAEITKLRGRPCFSQEERCKMLRSIKWVDEVIENTPFTPTLATLDEIQCDFVVCGDEDRDKISMLKNTDRFRAVPRATGISTKGLMDRILRSSSANQDQCYNHEFGMTLELMAERKNFKRSSFAGLSPLMLTTKRIIQFSNGIKPKPSDRIVYVASDFDLFHIGHINFLEAARSQGDFLIVGLHTDFDVQRYRGSDHPIMELHERALTVLACKYVHEVVFGAPYCVTEDLLEEHRVSVVCHDVTSISALTDVSDPYIVPKNRGCFKLLDTERAVTTEEIIQRISRNRLDFQRECSLMQQESEVGQNGNMNCDEKTLGEPNSGME